MKDPRTNSQLYNILYKPQKLFVDFLVDEKQGLEKETFKWGFFLGPGFGKTKMMSTMTELHNADLVLLTAPVNKVIEKTNIKDSWASELLSLGYTPYYSDYMKSKPYQREFYAALDRGDKVVYIFNYDQIRAKSGFRTLNYICGGLDAMKFPDRKDYLNALYDTTDKSEPFDEWSKKQGPNNGKGYQNICWIMDEAHAINNKKSDTANLVYKMLYKDKAPDLTYNRKNYFKDKIKWLYLGTGTPTSAKHYYSYFWLLKLLGHKWGETPVEVELFERMIDENQDEIDYSVGIGCPPKRQIRSVFNERKYKFEQKEENEHDYFVERYCVVENGWGANGFFKSFGKEFKRTQELLNVVENYAFFGETNKHFKLPPVVYEPIWISKGYGYEEMCNPNSKTYRVFDGVDATTAAGLYMRAKQLRSGFMGNEEKFKYYNLLRSEKLKELLLENEDNYLIFYNYTPELYAIIDAVESAGYKYDIFNGFIKETNIYYESERTGSTKNCIIANIDSGSSALNRQAWNIVLHYSLTSVYNDFKQSIGRVERNGQKADLIKCIMFMTPNSIDEKIHDSLLRGEDYTNETFERDFLTNIT